MANAMVNDSNGRRKINGARKNPEKKTQIPVSRVSRILRGRRFLAKKEDQEE